MAKQPKEPRYNRTIAVPASVMEPAMALSKALDVNMNTLIVEAIREYVANHQEQLHPERKRTA